MDWEFSVGFYPGVLLGMRSYTERNKNNHVMYLPFVDFCLTIFKKKKQMKEINRNILSDITVHMKYARYMPELNRRETWDELVERNRDMHIKKYPELEMEIRKAYTYVSTK